MTTRKTKQQRFILGISAKNEALFPVLSSLFPVSCFLVVVINLFALFDAVSPKQVRQVL
jgi:hypothetical protein